MLPLLIGGFALLLLMGMGKAARPARPEEEDRIQWEGRLWERVELFHYIRRVFGTMDRETYVAYLSERTTPQIQAWMDLLQLLDEMTRRAEGTQFDTGQRLYVWAAEYIAAEREPLIDPYAEEYTREVAAAQAEREEEVERPGVAPELIEATDFFDAVRRMTEEDFRRGVASASDEELAIRIGYLNALVAAGFNDQVSNILLILQQEQLRRQPGLAPVAEVEEVAPELQVAMNFVRAVGNLQEDQFLALVQGASDAELAEYIGHMNSLIAAGLNGDAAGILSILTGERAARAAPPPAEPEPTVVEEPELSENVRRLVAMVQGLTPEEVRILFAEVGDAGLMEGVNLMIAEGLEDGVILALRGELLRRAAEREGLPPAEPLPPPPEEEPPIELPEGYDPSEAQRLAGGFNMNLGARGCARYDRNLLRQFQLAAAITVDGLYGGGSRGALIYYGIPNPRRPCYAPFTTREYIPPEQR